MRFENCRTVTLLFASVVSLPVAAEAVATLAVARPSAVALWSPASSAVAQEPAAVEASLGLDRPTRRSIQQGLRNEGFDPGALDGLFGPRTRAAIRGWQASRGTPPSGYLNGTQAELLRSAGSSARQRGRDIAEPLDSPDPESVNCGGWNTEAFFETATASVVRACLAAGADIAARDDGDITPLHWAAWSSNDASVIEPLLAGGADLEARNDGGWTPLHNAAGGNENPAVVEALLVAGAELAAIDSEGAAPIQRAVWANGNPAVVRAFLRVGADLEMRFQGGRTLLHLAAQNNDNPGVIEALLAAGADVAARDGRGRTALHRAVVSNENPAVVEALLAAGADPAAGDNQGESPLQKATNPARRGCPRDGPRGERI